MGKTREIRIAQVRFFLLLIWAACVASYADPVGEKLVLGNASFDRATPRLLTINQLSDRAIINWQDFSISADEITRFLQPDASSAALNRVIGGNPSSIHGQLQANGQIFLINPAGILVGPTGRIDTKGFLASTLEMSDESFLHQARMRLSGDSEAAVRNSGQIMASDGNVFLIARTVENSGTIEAPQGTVGFAGASEVLLTETGPDRISVLFGGDGSVANSGLVSAAQAELKAAGGNLYALAINNTGVVRANTVVNEGGRIVLKAEGGTTSTSGNLDASGTLGGTVHVLGAQVALEGAAVVNVSGDAGGGVARIGGGFQGKESGVQNAKRSVVGLDAIINADAGNTGNGGDVVIWADDLTAYYGNITARGGIESGDGGKVEVSGKAHLAFEGGVDVGATSGASGSVLLDPRDLTINSSGSSDSLLTATGLLASSPDTTTDVTISSSAIAALTGNITLEASRNLAISSSLSLNNLGSGETADFKAGGNLTIGSAVSSAGGAMTFRASSGGVNSSSATLTVQGPVTGGDVTFYNSGGSGGIALSASIPNTGKNVTFEAKVIVGADLTVSGADLLFKSLNADATENNRTLTVTTTGTATFKGTVGGTGQFGTLLVNSSGGTTIKTSVIKSTTQVYKNPVTLGANTKLTGVNVQFDSTIDAAISTARNLTVNASANSVFNGAIGTSGGTITSITTDADGKTTLKGGTITATTQRFKDPVTLGANTALNGTTVNFGSSLDADLEANSRELTITASGRTTFTSGVGLGPDGTLGTSDDLGFGKLTTVNGGDTLFKGAGVKADVQGYGDHVLIGADQTLSGTTITFGRTLNGSGSGKALTINAGGATTFNGGVGTTKLLGALITDSAGTTSINTTAVKATTHTYNDPVTLGANVRLTGTTVTFENTVDGDVSDGRTLRINATTTEIKAGAKIGTIGLLKSLTTDAAGNTIISVSDGTIKATTQNFNDTLKLAVDTTLVGSTIRIVKSAINEPALTPRTLAINANLVSTIRGTLGLSGDPLSSLTTDGAGSTTMDTVSINVTTQTYNDPVTLAGNVTIDGTTITFANTVESNSANRRNLTLNTGATTFNGTIGATKKLGVLKTETTAGTTTISGGTVGAKTQTYEGAVSLTTDTTLSGTTVNFTAAFDPDTDSSHSLTINASGATTFANAFGTGNKFTTLTTDGSGTTKFGANVTTSGAQTYKDNVTLESSSPSLSVTLAGTDITFNKTVNSDDVSNTRNLTVTGSGLTTFKNVGNSKKLSNLTSDGGGTTILDGTIYKATSQSYADALTITKKVTITAEDGAGGGAVTFGSTVDGNSLNLRTLIVNSDGATTFTGAVGGTTGLKAITTDDVSGQSDTTVINGGSVTSITQTYNDAVTLGADTTVTGKTVTFTGTLNSSGAARDLTANVSDVIKFTSDVGKTLKLDVMTTDIVGSTVIEATEINAATQNYNDTVTIGANTTFQGVTGGTAATAVFFGKTLDADKTENNRTLNIIDTTTTFGGIVGGSGVFSSLTTDSTGSTVINTSAVNATAQTYGDNVTVGATVTVTGSTVQFDGTVNADAAANARALNLNASGGTIFKGTIGATEKLGTLTTAASSGNTQFFTGGNEVHATTQVYSDSVVLNDNMIFEGTDITFNDTMDGNGANRNITLTSSGFTKFNGVVGPSNVGTLTSDAGGLTKIAANITTIGAQTFNDSVVIAANVTLNATAANLVFNDTLNADLARDSRSLTLTTSGAITIGGLVGGTDPLGTLVQTAGASAVNLNGGSVNIGTQTYNNNVTLGADATLKGKDITFVGTVNGTQALTVSATGTTDFQSTVGNSSAITTLLTDNGGTTQLGGNVTTSANQTLNDAVVLTAGVAMNSGATVTLGSTVDGAFALSTPDNLVVSGAIGSGTQVASLSVTGTSSLGANVNTSGNQTYTGLATLTSDVTLTVGGSLDATGGINGGIGNFDLVLDVSSPKIGATPGMILGGNLSNVGDLTLSQAVTPSGTITTAGAQTYNGAVSLTATTTLSAPAISLNSTVNGAQSLTLAGSGVTTIGGVIGGTAAPTTLTINAGGLTSIEADVTVAGDLIVDDIVLLGTNATLASTGGAGNSISLKSVTGNSNNLTVNSSDTGTTAVTLAGTIGGVGVLDVTTGAGGTIVISGGTVTTTGTQDYHNKVSLSAATTLAGTTITADDLVDGTQTLTITGDAVFTGNVGSGTALGALSVSGSASIPAVVTTTGAAQTYTGAVTLSADAVLTGSTITMSSAVDGSVANTEGLTVAGSAVFSGVVGGTTPLETLVNTTGATSIGANVTTKTTAGGALNFTGQAVTLAAATVLKGETLAFGTIVGGGFDLTVDTANMATTTMTLGNISGVKDFTIEKAQQITGTLTTTGTQTYNGALKLAGATGFTGTTITTGASGTINEAQALTITGNAVFGAAIGATDLTSISVSGTTSLPASVDTTGAQAYTGPVTLTAGTTLTSTGGTVTFGGTVDGTLSLAIAGASGNVVFNGDVGGTTAVGALSVAGTTSLGANVTTTGATQGYTGLVTQTADSILTGSVLTITAGIAGGGFDTTLDFSGAQTLALGNITGVKDLAIQKAVTVSGTSNMSGTQVYTGNVTLNGGTTFASSGTGSAGDITFKGTVGGGQVMAVNTQGTLTLDGAVGGTQITSLTTDAGGSTIISGGSVSSTGAQTFGDSVTLGSDTVLTATALTLAAVAGGGNNLTITDDGALTIGGAISGVADFVQTAGASGVTISGGSITTTGDQTYNNAGVITLSADTTLTGKTISLANAATKLDGAFNLTLDFSGAQVTDLADLDNIVDLTFNKAATLSGTIVTTGKQTYNGAITLSAPTDLTGVGITLNEVIGGGTTLAITDTGALAFSGEISGLSTLTQNAGASSVTISGGSITTSGGQTYSQAGAVTLGADTTLTGSTLTFGGTTTLGGASGSEKNLTLDFSGSPTIDLGDIVNIKEFTLSKAATVGGNLTTKGTQTYSGALTLDASTTFASSGTGTDGDITFEGTIDGDAANRAFTVNTAGTTWFKKAVGASTALDILTTDSSTPGGTTKIGASITTDDSQTYNDNVQLMSSVVLAGTAANGGAGTITLNAVNGSGNNLTLSGAGDTKLLGNMTDLSTLASDNGGNTIVGVNTSSGSIAITSSSSQTFVDATTINQPTQFSGTPVTFLGTQTIDPNGSINP